MTRSGPNIAALFAAGLLTFGAPLAEAATSARLTGSIAGEVRNPAGVAQMGATVVLFNRYDRVLRQVLTNDKGAFIFDSLIPDFYSVRVTLNSFVPALKRNISVQPGLQSMLTINLAGLLSSIELVYTAPPQGALMSDDWKWVLRSSQANRPVLRFRDVIYQEPREKETHARVFSETRGLVRFSAGDSGSHAGVGAQPDLGTSFALVTSLFGSNQLQVSGGVGYNQHSGMPAAGFRTTYSRSDSQGATPEVTVSMRQVNLPTRGGFGMAAGQDGPSLRTMSATFVNRMQLLDNLRMEYGASLESVSMVDRLNTVSPFARLNYDMGPFGLILVGYSTGAPPVEMANRPVEPSVVHEAELNQDLTALASLPLVSIKGGHARVQKSDNIEIGYKKVVGSRSYSFGAYRERLKDAILTLGGDAGTLYASGDLLPDLGSKSAVLDAGNFSRWGYLASVTQNIHDDLDVTLAYGRTGALTADAIPAEAFDGTADLRSSLRMADRNWASVRVSGTAPGTGTRFVASYGWMDPRTVMPERVSLTQPSGPGPGLNLSVRQPIPSGSLPGRLEAIGEMRNLTAQGYLPVGRGLVLTNSPRSVRGGLSFIF